MEPQLTPAEIKNLEHWLSLSAPSNLADGLRRLCAQAQSAVPMREAIEGVIQNAIKNKGLAVSKEFPDREVTAIAIGPWLKLKACLPKPEVPA